MVALILMSAPLASLLFPMIFAASATVSNILGVFLRTPDFMEVYGVLVSSLTWERGPLPAIAAAAVVVAPGAAAALFLHARIVRFLSADASGALKRSLGARPPAADDAEERQLANIIEEMSIAAGVEAPEVFLADAGANAGAFLLGRGAKPFAVVSRPLLEALDRDQTQGLAAQLVAMHSLGDDRRQMRAVTSLLAVDLTGAVLAAAYDGAARRRLACFFSTKNDPESRLAALMAVAFEPQADFGEKDWRQYAFLPFLLAHATFNLVRMLAGLLFVSPMLSLFMRRRRFLADATAVQLTRNPDGVKGALLRISSGETDAQASVFLGNFLAAGSNDGRAFKDAIGATLSTHPRMRRRTERLEAMGAALAAGRSLEPPPMSPLNRLLIACGGAVVALLSVVLVGAMLYAATAMTMLSFVVCMVAALAVAGLTGVLRG